MGYRDLGLLIRLNERERGLERIQEDINRARKKYFDVSEIQLRLDRRQAELDKMKKKILDEKASVISPN